MNTPDNHDIRMRHVPRDFWPLFNAARTHLYNGNRNAALETFNALPAELLSTTAAYQHLRDELTGTTTKTQSPLEAGLLGRQRSSGNLSFAAESPAEYGARTGAVYEKVDDESDGPTSLAERSNTQPTPLPADFKPTQAPPVLGDYSQFADGLTEARRQADRFAPAPTGEQGEEDFDTRLAKARQADGRGENLADYRYIPSGNRRTLAPDLLGVGSIVERDRAKDFERMYSFAPVRP